MTKVKINPGVCGFITSVEAESEDGQEVRLKIKSGCEPVRKMFDEDQLGGAFDSFEVCLMHPGEGSMLAYAREKFPIHCGCPVLSGIVKAVEAECRLALPRDATITFEKE